MHAIQRHSEISQTITQPCVPRFALWHGRSCILTKCSWTKNCEQLIDEIAYESLTSNNRFSTMKRIAPSTPPGAARPKMARPCGNISTYAISPRNNDPQRLGTVILPRSTYDQMEEGAPF